jgi:AraC-like DNA-binding protein
MATGRAWVLEQSDRRALFAGSSDLTLFGEYGPAQAGPHRHPVWKVLLPLDGYVRVLLDGRPPVYGRGMLVPPQLEHRPATSSGYVALFVPPWQVGRAGEPAPIPPQKVRRLLAALRVHDLQGAPDLDAARAELADLLGAPRTIDPRVGQVLGDLEHARRIDDLAAGVGLSPVRLRALVKDEVGVSLVQLRQWRRLGTAIAHFRESSIGTAAALAGFADQAHLTRVTRRFTGRTPTTIASSPAPCRWAPETSP